jgi:hypothetical protein
MGYRSIDDPLRRPWDYRDKAQNYNPKMQAMVLEALLKEFMPQPWWQGALFGNGFPIILMLGEKIIRALHHRIN